MSDAFRKGLIEQASAMGRGTRSRAPNVVASPTRFIWGNRKEPPLQPDRTSSAATPWHGNWAREWRVGRFAFEIEWVPRARYYVFSFTINTPEADLRHIDEEAGYGPRVKHGTGHIVEVRERPPFVIEEDE